MIITQSLLQKWLRDIHNIRIQIEDISPLRSEIPHYRFFIKTTNTEVFDWLSLDTNYEICLERVLLSALYLIK